MGDPGRRLQTVAGGCPLVIVYRIWHRENKGKPSKSEEIEEENGLVINVKWWYNKPEYYLQKVNDHDNY